MTLNVNGHDRSNELPSVQVIVNGTRQMAILDSGAMISLVNANIVKSNGKRSQKVLTTVDGTLLNVQGSVDLSVELNGKTIQNSFQIVKFGQSSFDFILGIDFLRKVGLKMNLESVGMLISNICEKELKGSLKLGENVHLPPCAAKLVRGHSKFAKDVIVEKFVGLPKGIEVLDAIIPGQEYWSIYFVNTTPTEVVLQKGDRVLEYCSSFEAEKRILNVNGSNEKERDMDPTQGRIGNSFDLSHLNKSDQQKVEEFLKIYKNVFAQSVDELGKFKGPAMEIHLTDDIPVRRKQYPLAKSLENDVDKEIEKLLRAGIIEESTSAYMSPLLAVRKKDGSVRILCDLRGLNKKIRVEQFPIPNVEILLSRIGSAKHLSSFDMLSGYFQCPIEKKDRHKTAFATPHRGLFQYARVPQGLSSSPSYFSRIMSNVLREFLHKNVEIFIDDIVIYSDSTLEEHLKIVGKVFDRLLEYDLRLKPSKCELLKDSVSFLGHKIGGGFMKPQDAKIHTIKSFPAPTNVTELKGFLGLMAFYKQYIPDFSNSAYPLNKLLRKGVDWVWEKDQTTAFEKLKNAITSDTFVLAPNFDKEFYLFVDGSGKGLGAILSQANESGDLLPVAYSSRTLTPAETRYNSTEIELTAAVFGAKRFSYYLLGRHFHLVTDCQALKYILDNPASTNRLARLSLKLSDFTFTVTHRAGLKMKNVDALSRHFPINAVLTTKEVTLDQLKQDQERDSSFQEILRYLKGKVRYPKTSAKLDQFVLGKHGLLYHISEVNPSSIDEEVKFKLCVPSNIRQQIIRSCHESPSAGHGGRATTTNRVRMNYFWPNLVTDCLDFVSRCISCQKNNVAPPAAKLAYKGTLPVPEKAHTFFIDIIGPLQLSLNGNKYILVAVDAFTKYPEAIAIPDITAKTVADAFLRMIVYRHGAPKKLVSDRGSQFTSHLFKEILQILGTESVFGVPYHHATTATVERMNQTIERILCHYGKVDVEWDQYLDSTLFAIRTAINTSTGYSPHFLTYGQDATFNYAPILAAPIRNYSDNFASSFVRRLNVAFKNVERSIETSVDKRVKRSEENVRPLEFKEGEIVYVRHLQPEAGKGRKLKNKYLGPYRIVEQISDSSFDVKPLEGTKGNKRRVHISHLRKGKVPHCFPLEQIKEVETQRELKSNEPEFGSHSEDDSSSSDDEEPKTEHKQGQPENIRETVASSRPQRKAANKEVNYKESPIAKVIKKKPIRSTKRMLESATKAQSIEKRARTESTNSEFSEGEADTFASATDDSEDILDKLDKLLL